MHLHAPKRKKPIDYGDTGDLCSGTALSQTYKFPDYFIPWPLSCELSIFAAHIILPTGANLLIFDDPCELPSWDVIRPDLAHPHTTILYPTNIIFYVKQMSILAIWLFCPECFLIFEIYSVSLMVSCRNAFDLICSDCWVSVKTWLISGINGNEVYTFG